ncbi:unnamed protein product [Ophioblennius macclurei]
MDRNYWEQTVTGFQAHARGYLLRTEICHAQMDFEEVVKEIDGALNHLKWEDVITSFPQFTQTSPFLQSSDVSTASPSVGRKQMEAEKDLSPRKSAREHCEAVMESTTWSTPGQAHKAPLQHGSFEEWPWTPEDLWLHRNTLTMELLWIQQAIYSRKRYLFLKDRLSVS